MKVAYDYPPNIDAIRAEFDLPTGVIFTYGETLYNPDHGVIPPDLMAHEETHQRQQGDDPAGWWKRYLEDVEFRISQEVEAYQNQYNHYKMNRCMKNGKLKVNRLRQFAYQLATYLSSPIYGEVITRQEALEKIKQGDVL